MSEQDTSRIGEVYDRLVELERTQTESRQTAGERLQSYREYGGNAVAINLSEVIEPGAELKTEIAEDYNLQPDTSFQTVRNGDSYNLDTREQLEADVYRAADELDAFYCGERFINTRKIIGWLDRQAAITERELCAKCEWPSLAAQPDKEAYDRIAELTAERDGALEKGGRLFDKCLELTAERNELQAKVDSLRKRNDGKV